MADITQDTATSTDLVWARPHPLTIIVELGSAARQILVALALVGFDVIDLGSLVELALVLGPLGAALARWYTTRYAVDGEAFHHHHGLLWRRRQVLPRANIQNVSTTAGVVARLGSVVELNVSDASSSGDIKLRFLSRGEADRLTALLRSAPPPGPALGPAPTTAAVAQPPLVAPTLRRLAKMEATSVPVLLLGLVTLATAVAGPWLVVLGPGQGLAAVAGRAVAVAGAVAIVAATAGLQVASRLVVLGRFRLAAEPDRLRIQAGVLTESRVTARRERIQQLQVERDLPHRLLGWERVLFETADVDSVDAAGVRFLDPAAAAGTWRTLGREVFGRVDVDEGDLHPVSPRARRRVLVRFAVAAMPATALGFVDPLIALAVVGPWLVTGWWYAGRRQRELGWVQSDDQLLVRTGVLRGRLRLVDLDKVQIIRLDATWFQRRSGLVTLRLSTAGHGFAGLVAVPDLDEPVGERLLAALAYRSAQTPTPKTL